MLPGVSKVPTYTYTCTLNFTGNSAIASNEIDCLSCFISAKFVSKYRLRRPECNCKEARGFVRRLLQLRRMRLVFLVFERKSSN